MSLGASFPDFSRFPFSSLQILDQKMEDGDNEKQGVRFLHMHL